MFHIKCSHLNKNVTSCYFYTRGLLFDQRWPRLEISLVYYQLYMRKGWVDCCENGLNLPGSEDAVGRREGGHKYITYIFSGHLYHLFLWCWTGHAVLVLSCLRRSSDQFLNGSETHPSAVRPVTPGVMWCTGRHFINSPTGQRHTPRLRGGRVRGC